MKTKEDRIVELEKKVAEMEEQINDIKKNIAQEVLSLVQTSICEASKTSL